MKLSISARINYQFNIELPPEFNGAEATIEDILIYCDITDPVFQEICKVFTKENIEFDADIVSIVDEDTDTIIYEY